MNNRTKIIIGGFVGLLFFIVLIMVIESRYAEPIGIAVLITTLAGIYIMLGALFANAIIKRKDKEM